MSQPPNASAGQTSDYKPTWLERLRGSDWDPRRSIFQNIAIRLGSKPGGPHWDPKLKRFETQWRLYVVLWFVIAVTVIVITWVIYQPIVTAKAQALPAGANLTVVLAPVLAAAAGIERFLETIFGIVEGNWRTLVAYLGRGLRWLQNAETEVDSAREWLARVSAEYTHQLRDLPNFSASDTSPAVTPPAQSDQPGTQSSLVPPAGQPTLPTNTGLTPQALFVTAQDKLKTAKDLMDLAEKRLKTAEDELSQVTSSDGYRNAKRAASIYLGLLLGLMVATAGSLQMFAMMGVSVGHPKVDVIITGLVIGSGSAPVHSLINILQSAKDTLDSAQGWLQSTKKKAGLSE